MLRAIGLGAQGPSSPAFRIRLGMQRAPLRAHGVDLELLPLLSEHQAQVFGRGRPHQRAQVALAGRRALTRGLEHSAAEVAVVQRQVDLLPSLHLERRASRGRRVILDIDDSIWLDADRDAGGHWLALLKGTRRKLAWLARRADHVMTGNELLGEWFTPYCDAITVVPSTVDVATVPVAKHEASGRVVLGWIGSGTTARYIAALGATLRTISRASPEVQFELHVVGADMPPIDGIRVIPSAWSPEAERVVLEQMDIGLMPLPDNAWTRHKCAYKALQYMAAGVPVVADDVGISAQVVGDREAGIIVSEPADWVEAITELAQQPALRARLGSAGRRRVEQDFSTERWAPVIASVIRGDPVREALADPPPNEASPPE